MRPPFARPFFAKFFYVLAVIGAALAALLILTEIFGLYQILGAKFAMMLAVYGVFVVVLICGSALTMAAIGYVIELLAKIEWNTRPDTDGMGYVAGTVAGAGPALTDKQYFLSEKGKVLGPLSAPEMLNLYRDGKVSSTAQIAVEENGQRRVLKNWSEVGL